MVDSSFMVADQKSSIWEPVRLLLQALLTLAWQALGQAPELKSTVDDDLQALRSAGLGGGRL